MEIPDKIDFAAQRLKEGNRVNLKEGIETSPAGPFSDSAPSDDDSLGLDDIVLEGTPSAVEQAEEQSESAPTSAEPDTPKHTKTLDSSSSIEDPTFRIGSLPAANRKLIVVNQNDSLTKAITLMLQHDFSQLPVMQGEREVKGVITWKSIGSKQALGHNCNQVGDCREDARIVDSNRTLFDAISTIVEYGYVLVRDQRDRRITGIVTASDLSLQFQILAEPFLLLREIELHVRRLLGDKLSVTDFDLLDTVVLGTQSKPQSVADLTFGQYVRLFQHPQLWAKLNLKIDCGTLTGLLDEGRLIRNDVMHFDPDASKQPPQSHSEDALSRSPSLSTDLPFRYGREISENYRPHSPLTHWMIHVTRLNQSSVVLNSDLIEQIESTPDTLITLTNNQKLIVLETADEIVERIRLYRRSILLPQSAGV